RGPRGPPHGPPGREADDGPRALADLPDAPALEVRGPGLREARVHQVLPGRPPPPPGLAVYGGPGRRAPPARRPDLPEEAHSGGAPSPGDRGAPGPPALLPPGRLVGGDRGRGARGDGPPLPGRGRPPGEDEGLPEAHPPHEVPARGGPAHRRDRPLRIAP